MTSVISLEMLSLSLSLSFSPSLLLLPPSLSTAQSRSRLWGELGKFASRLASLIREGLESRFFRLKQSLMHDVVRSVLAIRLVFEVLRKAIPV